MTDEPAKQHVPQDSAAFCRDVAAVVSAGVPINVDDGKIAKGRTSAAILIKLADSPITSTWPKRLNAAWQIRRRTGSVELALDWLRWPIQQCVELNRIATGSLWQVALVTIIAAIGFWYYDDIVGPAFHELQADASITAGTTVSESPYSSKFATLAAIGLTALAGLICTLIVSQKAFWLTLPLGGQRYLDASRDALTAASGSDPHHDGNDVDQCATTAQNDDGNPIDLAPVAAASLMSIKTLFPIVAIGLAGGVIVLPYALTMLGPLYELVRNASAWDQ